MAKELDFTLDLKGYTEAFSKHKDISRQSAEKKFKGGLADESYETTKLHTATHLLAEALRRVLSKDIEQKGSNITAERLRFDFNFPRKITDQELKKVETLINKEISKGLDVSKKEMSVAEAKKMGAHGVFEQKYGEKIYFYSIGDFSKEICGGPHVKNTTEIGKFTIVKEESVSAGVRRIKAVVG
jgi:alanyl-tRNA synthetase